MIKVNLLPKSILERRKRGAYAIFVSSCAGLTILICVFFVLALKFQFAPVARQLDSVRKQAEEYQSRFRNLKRDELKEAEARLKSYLEALLDLTSYQPPWPLILYEISKGLPEGVWLTEITKPVTDEILTIQGNSLYRTKGVIEFMENLNKASLFKEVNFSNMSKKMVREVEVTEFKLTCKLDEAHTGKESG
jgi:Tfp pilus assembly protein PilN